jgi:sarcosine oxidase subunit gamma
MGYQVDISRLGAQALFDLKGSRTALQKWAGKALPDFPEMANTACIKGDMILMHVGRDHWLVHAPLGQEASLEAVLKPTAAPCDISVVRVSDTLAFFAITGRDADQVMAVATPLDVHTRSFPDAGATYSEFFGLKGLIVRQSGGYLCAVEQSFGDMIEDYLTRAIS